MSCFLNYLEEVTDVTPVETPPEQCGILHCNILRLREKASQAI